MCDSFMCIIFFVTRLEMFDTCIYHRSVQVDHVLRNCYHARDKVYKKYNLLPGPDRNLENENMTTPRSKFIH